MSEGSVRSLEDECPSLKSVAKEVAEERPRRLAEVADLTARLRTAEERVRPDALCQRSEMLCLHEPARALHVMCIDWVLAGL